MMTSSPYTVFFTHQTLFLQYPSSPYRIRPGSSQSQLMMKRGKKNPDAGDPLSNSDTRTGSSELNAMNPSLSSMKSMGLLLAVLMVASVMFSLSVVLKDPPSDGVVEVGAASRLLQIRLHPGTESEDGLSEKKEQLGDINLVASSFDKELCLSRYEASLYRKESPFKQSSYLNYRLQRYEDLHRRCGPFTRSYNLTLDKLKFGDQSDGGDSVCRYVIWLNSNGELGNRMLSLASAFLYALLTNRVLLVELGVDMADLFSEPFPNTSWFLPLEFPLNEHESGNSMLAYRHLVDDASDQQKLFFCGESQVLLEETPWLIMKADSFFLPSLFSISSFKQELEKLFPEKETAFHFLGQYLFHPTNAVWGLITRYYRTYLARADQRIGIYIGVSKSGNDQFQYLVDQILACGTRYKPLPEVDKQRHLPSSQVLIQKSKAVFVSSSSPRYFESIRDIYWENPTVMGEIISVQKLSHKDYQKTSRNMEYKRAWAEIYLLSCTDVLVVTSSGSSLMDVAHGLGGLTPWVLNKAENGTAYEPYCVRARSIEPCSQATLFQSCKN